MKKSTAILTALPVALAIGIGLNAHHSPAPEPAVHSTDAYTVQVPFSLDCHGTRFQDALNLAQAQFDALTEQQLKEMEQARCEKWHAFVVEQSKPKPISREQLERQITDLDTNIAELVREKQALQAKVRSLPAR